MHEVYIKGFFTLLGAFSAILIKMVFDYFKDKRDRQDKYYFALLEKRFKALHEAYALVAEMRHAINPTKVEQREVLDKEVSDWYNANCLYLPPELRNEFWQTVNDVNTYHLDSDDYQAQGRSSHQWKTPEMIQKKEQLDKKYKNITTGMQEKIEKHIKKYYDMAGK